MGLLTNLFKINYIYTFYECCRLRKEVKQLVIVKKLNIWNELAEKVHTDFDENKKEFWAYVGRKTKGKKNEVASVPVPGLNILLLEYRYQ